MGDDDADVGAGPMLLDLPQSVMTMYILPRQARDKDRKSWRQEVFLCRAAFPEAELL